MSEVKTVKNPKESEMTNEISKPEKINQSANHPSSTRISIFDNEGKEIKKTKLPEKIFNVEANNKLIHQAIVAIMANSRQSNAHTKTRAEVSGGGAKPWKQKGTGRARAGSTRSPLWVGGGITFGPRNDRNYTQDLTKKMRRKALFMALTTKANDNKIIVVDDFKMEAPKTKQMIEILAKLPAKDGTVLVVLPESDINVELSASNIPYVKAIHLSSLNILELARYEYLLTTEAGLKAIEELFAASDKPAKDSKES
jgi:large subunit ribosomal protein L4